ncbi:MAG: hypothetical protein J7599_01090 [Niabella sp.]|nr:hypothetical protein [Niabella sp.]
MKSFVLFAVFLFTGFAASAQSRKAGGGQQDFIVVTTDTAKKKARVSAPASRQADSQAVHNKTRPLKTPAKKN